MEIKRDLLLTQIVNFALIFFLMKYFFGDKMIKAVEERKQLIKKLKGADEEYAKMIDLAKNESNKIILSANKTKETLLQEGRLLADEERKKILDLAMNKSALILQEAEAKGERMHKELETQWTDAVTTTTQRVVHKLLHTHDALKEEYLETIAKEVKNLK